MTENVFFVQEPDYVGFQAVDLPLKALGAVYDGADPYATPLGVVFVVRESCGVCEVYVPRERRTEEGRVIYTHDLSRARYVVARNGFEAAHVHVGHLPVLEETKSLLRSFFGAQTPPAGSRKFLLEVRG